jgi:hypothetical protein
VACAPCLTVAGVGNGDFATLSRAYVDRARAGDDGTGEANSVLLAGRTCRFARLRFEFELREDDEHGDRHEDSERKERASRVVAPRRLAVDGRITDHRCVLVVNDRWELVALRLSQGSPFKAGENPFEPNVLAQNGRE